MISVALGSAAIASITMSCPLRSISAPVDTTSGPGDLELVFGGPPVARRELAEIDPGAMHADVLRWHAHRDHVAPHGVRYGQEAICPSAGAKHLGGGGCGFAPMVDVAAARLNRDGNAETLAQRDCSRAVGEEERRVDHVERKIVAQVGQQRGEGAGH